MHCVDTSWPTLHTHRGPATCTMYMLSHNKPDGGHSRGKSYPWSGLPITFGDILINIYGYGFTGCTSTCVSSL